MLLFWRTKRLQIDLCELLQAKTATRTAGATQKPLMVEAALRPAAPEQDIVSNVGALIIRIGFWRIIYSNYNKEPPNSISDYEGPCSTLLVAVRIRMQRTRLLASVRCQCSALGTCAHVESRYRMIQSHAIGSTGNGQLSS